jgi:hypothetical protein
LTSQLGRKVEQVILTERADLYQVRVFEVRNVRLVIGADKFLGRFDLLETVDKVVQNDVTDKSVGHVEC